MIIRNELVLIICVVALGLMGCNRAQGNQIEVTSDVNQSSPKITTISRKSDLTDGTVFFSHVTAIDAENYLGTIVAEPRLFQLKRTESKWRPLESFPQSDWTLNSVSIIDGRKGFVLANGGTMFRTADGGNSWTGVSRFTNLNLTHLEFADLTIGYLTAELALVYDKGVISYRIEVFKTYDGGDTWKSIYSKREGDGPVFAVIAESANNVTLIIGGKRLVSSFNGGETWSEVISNESITDLAFTGGIGWSVNKSGEFLRTDNRGKNWRKISDAAGFSDCNWNAVETNPQGIGFAISSEGCVAYTQDGRSWLLMTSRIDDKLSSLFSSRFGGLIVGEQNAYRITF